MMLFLQACLFYNFLAHFFINLFCTQPFTTNFKSTGPVAFGHACLGYICECQSSFTIIKQSPAFQSTAVCDWRWPTWPRRTWPRTIRVKQIIFITDLMILRIRWCGMQLLWYILHSILFRKRHCLFSPNGSFCGNLLHI